MGCLQVETSDHLRKVLAALRSGALRYFSFESLVFFPSLCLPFLDPPYLPWAEIGGGKLVEYLRVELMARPPGWVCVVVVQLDWPLV